MNAYSLPYVLKQDDQLFFLHIPKTAGTTLIQLLDSHFMPEEICPGQLPDQVADIPYDQMARYRLLRGHLDYDFFRVLPKKPVYLTMLREPVDRVISFYEFWKRNSDEWVVKYPHYGHTFRKAVEKDPYLFITSKIDNIRAEIVNSQVRRIVSNANNFLENLPEAQVLQIAKRRLEEEFLFFGLVEQFDASMELLSYSLAWRPVYHYERKMVATTRKKRHELPNKVIDAILERNQLDLKLYAYAQELFEERFRQMRYALLEKQYEQCFQANHPQVTGGEFLFDQVVSGDGWYEREYNPDGSPYRWLGPGKQASVDINLAHQSDFEIKIFINNTIHSCILAGFKLLVNGEPVVLEQVVGNDYQGVFRGVISAEMLKRKAELTRITFTVQDSFCPHEMNPALPDNRRLSLACYKLVLTPLTAA